MIPTLQLRSGDSIPVIGLGTWSMHGAEAQAAVASALDAGFRHIDTAASYDNEAAVGRGIAEAGIDRKDAFVTTKLRGEDQGSLRTKAALRGSLDRLGLDYVDLFLIHWPLPGTDKYVQSFEAMAELADEGLVRNLGVSNFKAHHLDRLITETGRTPEVNQIQLAPDHARVDPRAYMTTAGIQVVGWRPFSRNARLLADPVLTKIAATLGRSVAQVILRWHVQQDIVVIPKSASPQRQRANLEIFDFSLSEEQMAHIARLDNGEEGLVDSDVHEEF